MDKKTKVATSIIVVLVVVLGIVGFVLNHLDAFSWIDKYGFKHNVEADATYVVDENKGRDYAIVELDDKYETLSGHEFLDKINTVLNAYANKTYTTFTFKDGTGLYFPESDINNVAFYGVVDETGIVTETQKYVYISGTQIETEDASEMYSKKSQDLMDLIPDNYQSDSFFAATDGDSTAYFTTFDTGDINAMINELYGYAKQVGCTTAYFNVMSVDANYGYIVTDAGITADDSAINVVEEYIANQN